MISISLLLLKESNLSIISINHGIHLLYLNQYDEKIFGIKVG